IKTEGADVSVDPEAGPVKTGDDTTINPGETGSGSGATPAAPGGGGNSGGSKKTPTITPTNSPTPKPTSTPTPTDSPTPTPTPLPGSPPELLKAAVKYHATSPSALEAQFTFNMNISKDPDGLTADNGAKIIGYALNGSISGSALTVQVDTSGTVSGKKFKISGTAKNAKDLSADAEFSGEFYAVDGVFARPDEPAIYSVLEWEADENIVKLNDGRSDKWYFVPANENFRGIFDAIWTPNKDNKKAIALFHVKFGETKEDDKIEIKGTDVPKSENVTEPVTIHIGDPDKNNNSLPDFVIPEGGLGDGTDTYLGTILQINNGAYLNIASDQSVDNAFNLVYSPGTVGKFRSGSVYVMSGGKVRDSAYKAWPLGEGSVFTIYKGAYMAVGPGDRNGNAPVGDPVAQQHYNGWLIGENGKVEFGGANEDIDEPCVVVTNESVALKGTAIVKKNVSLMYDLWLTSGSKLTVDSGATLTFINGTNDNTGTAKAIYGQPVTSGGFGAGEVTKSRPASEVVVDGTIESQDTATNIFGGSSGQNITSGTWRSTNTETAGTGPVNNWGEYYKVWSEHTP
ncbi:MAG: hypothetical protein LBS84_08355, partial [Clostridiales bacterium]|nr:hypothetical protein [Clostridiales bacterium]